MGGWADYRATRGGASGSVVGDLRVLQGLESPQLGATRDVLVLLPEGAYETGRRYPVLYMHDGQNLFDAATSFAGEWEVDEALAALGPEGIEAIVVGVPNGGARRYSEYTPYPAGDAAMPRVGEGGPYVRFLVETVKPLVDAEFPTRADRAGTGIMGSSLGGLISLWAAFEHASTFGFVGAMSPAIPRTQRQLLDLMRRATARPERIYVDVGGREGDHGAADRLAEVRSRAFEHDARRIRDALVDGGSRLSEDLLYVEEPDAVHHESAWARRLPGALRFLLGPFAPGPLASARG